ncbi:hypothetical protein PROFUN_05513 [Planoprotostelium fungivorum]|uniref:Uncharacterized protein n=1 Tax=Planoprotostelium fungivorum TaxID=1890364 RepID=A0A2P6NQY3_9EUKA|nr:hypothetical protein PROFUN_05513 [Planoprotostelium fungivorum]
MPLFDKKKDHHAPGSFEGLPGHEHHQQVHRMPGEDYNPTEVRPQPLLGGQRYLASSTGSEALYHPTGTQTVMSQLKLPLLIFTVRIVVLMVSFGTILPFQTGL